MKIKIGKSGGLREDFITFSELVDKSKRSLGIIGPNEELSEYEWAAVLTNCFFRMLPTYTKTRPVDKAIEYLVGTLRTMKKIHKIPPVSEDFINRHFDKILEEAMLIPTIGASDEAVENFNYVVEKDFEPVKRLLRDP